MKIETNTYYDSRVNTDIERFYQLSDSEQDLVINDAYVLYNKTRKWAIDAGIYEGADVCYDRNLDIFCRMVNNTHRYKSCTYISEKIQSDNAFLSGCIQSLYKQINPNFIQFMYRPETYPNDVILVMRGTYDYQMFEQQEPLDNNKLDYFFNRDTLNKNWPIREQINHNLYKNSKPFQIIDIAHKDKYMCAYLGLGYGEFNPQIVIKLYAYDARKINEDITVIDLFGNFPFYNEKEISDYKDYLMTCRICKLATFSEIIAFVVAKRFPSN